LGGADDFFDFTEVNTFCCSRWHFDLWFMSRHRLSCFSAKRHNPAVHGRRPGTAGKKFPGPWFPDPFEICFNALF